jgi:hypothetical protein
MSALDITPPKAKASCQFADWFQETWPDGSNKGLLFRCKATGYVSKPGGKKEKGVDVKTRCSTCILYKAKEIA